MHHDPQAGAVATFAGSDVQTGHADNLTVDDRHEYVIVLPGAVNATLGPGQSFRGDRHRVVNAARQEPKLMYRLGIVGPDRSDLDL